MDTQPGFDEKDVHKRRNYRALRSVKVQQDTFSSIIVPSLLKKLPEQIKLLITRGKDKYD